MCGRTALAASPEELQDVFELAELPVVAPHYNVPPSQPVHIVRAIEPGGRRALQAVRWGLIPFWAKDSRAGSRLVLARSETVMTASAYRDAICKRRCLVAVDAFYEWQRDGKHAHPFAMRRDDGKPFALAGIWERWTSREDGEIVESCAIITQPAQPPFDAVHGRMPLVLPTPLWKSWLDSAVTSESSVTPLLAPTVPSLVIYEVAARVNDPRHDDASCLARAERGQQALLW